MASTSETTATPVIRLAHKNILLRPYQDADAPAMHKHLNNPNILKNLRNRIPNPYTLADAQGWIEFTRAQGPEGPQPAGPFNDKTPNDAGSKSEDGASLVATLCGIILTNADGTEDEFIGSIGLKFGDPGEIYCRSAELGYWLAEEHWGRGIMGEVVKAFSEWALRTWGRLVRIEAHVSGANKASQRVLERAGYQVEGRRRNAVWKNGCLDDEVILAMVRSLE